MFQLNHALHLPARSCRNSANKHSLFVPVGVLPARGRQFPLVLLELCTGRASRLFFLHSTVAGASPAECHHSRFQAACSGPEPAPPSCCMASEHHIRCRQSLLGHPLSPFLFPNGNGPRFPGAAKGAMFPMLAAGAELCRLFRGRKSTAWHQAIAWRFKSSSSAKLRPGKKFSCTYHTSRSILPFVCGTLTRQTLGTTLISTTKSENCVFQIILPTSRLFTTVFMLSVRTSLGTPPNNGMRSAYNAPCCSDRSGLQIPST